MNESPEHFLKMLKEFLAADELLSSQLKLYDDEALSQREDLALAIKEAETLIDGHWQQIQGVGTSQAGHSNLQLSAEAETELALLRDQSDDIHKKAQELNEVKNRLLTLQNALKEALQLEEDERGILEERRKAALLKEKRDRRRKIVTRLVVAMALIALLLAAHFLLLKGTTLNFDTSADNKIESSQQTAVTLDGKPFSSGDTIKPGHHRLSIELQNFEPIEKEFWSFYGKKDLGTLLLESSKGSLLVTVKPSPATLIINQGGQKIKEGDAPLKIDKLPVGDYSIDIRRGDHRESSSVRIEREHLTETNIVLDLGSVQLSSQPPDAEFKLMQDGEVRWQGNLPTTVSNIPSGYYHFIARRKGWELSENITIERDTVGTGFIEFPYGSLEVTSDPPGLVASTNGVEIGKTPINLQEVQPGRYAITITDGENDMIANVEVSPKEAAKRNLVFHYGTVHVSTTPPGVTVTRKGKVAGITPITLEHIPTGDTILELQLNGYVSTNVLIRATEGTAKDVSVKLTSERYLQAMSQARETFEAGQFANSQKFIATALESDPNDSAAISLRDEVAQAAAKAEEALRAEQARIKARALASLTWLDFQTVITDCTDTKEVQYPVSVADGYYDKKGKFQQTGQHIEMQTRTESTFNQTTFSQKYEGRTFGFNCPDTWRVLKVEKDGSVILKAGGIGSDEIVVTARTSNQDALKSLQKGQKVTIKGTLNKFEMRFLVRALYLEDAEVLDK